MAAAFRQPQDPRSIVRCSARILVCDHPKTFEGLQLLGLAAGRTPRL
jgi:hypothetical protein